MHIKTKTRRCFNRAKLTYDLNAELQQSISKQLIRKLHRNYRYFANIIDIGCGTGLSTQFLKNTFSWQNFLAIDLADELLSVAKSRSIASVCADFDNIPVPNQQFDLVFANMALQWSTDLSVSLREIARITKKNGLLAASLPIYGTFSELKQLLYQSTGAIFFNEFVSLDTFSTFLSESGYQLVSLQAKQHHFTYPDLKTALQSFKKVGALANNCCRPLTKSLYQKVLPISPKLNYHIAQLVAQKL